MSDGPKTTPAYGARTKARASFWCVHVRTMQKWLAASPPVPVDDIVAMLRWVAAMPSASQAKLTPAFRRRIDEERMKLERAGAPAAPILDPDYAEFLRTHAATTQRESSLLADLKLQAAFALFKLQRAQARGDLPAVKDATETLRYISGVVHDEELRAQKLGREVGDIIPRRDAEALARALLYWLMRSHDDLLAAICPPIATASSTGPLYREEVRALIEPHTLATRVLQPFDRAAKISAGHALPPWLVAAMREAAAATLEDGAALFATLYSEPLPPPAPPPLLDGSGI